MMNKALLVGRLGADPDTRTTESGKTVTNLRVATWYTRKVEGEFETITEWHNVVSWQEFFPDVGKGDMVQVEGMLQTRNYVDKTDVKRYVTEIVGHVKKVPGAKADSDAAADREKHQDKAQVPEAQPEPEDDGLPF